ncbi:hypothetical protein BJF78_13800 [Pseudonocardia sp. CNS-139]|nr:hypothetical protein BJF78_13800 [Pseudonocardia sp. CNS-139]
MMREPVRERRAAALLRRRWWPAAFALAALVVWGGLATMVVAPPLGGHRELSGREWQRLAADPEGHAGEQVIVYGVVTRPGEGTRRDVVGAAVDGLDRADPADYPTAAELTGADPALVAGDMFRAEVTVTGAAGEAVALLVNRLRPLG